MRHGFRYKIAYALKDIEFKGNIYIVDTSKEVLEYVKIKYEEMLPKANIICINQKFEDAFSDVPEKIDLLLSNHCIDDMIISEYMQNYNDNMNDENFRELLTISWKKLGKDCDKVEKIIEKIYSVFDTFFREKDIKKIIISQYKSNAYFKDNFKEMDEITEKCFKKIKSTVYMDNRIYR